MHFALRDEGIIGGEKNLARHQCASQEKDLENAPLFLHFDPCELEALIPDLSKYETNGEIKMDAKASTDLVLNLNRRLADFFRAYAEKFAETQGKQVLLSFAGQEEEHNNSIRQIMNENAGA